MEKIISILFFCAVISGCGSSSGKKPAEAAGNSATRYVEGLQGDKSRAVSAIEEYNKSVHKEESLGQEAADR